MTSSRIDHDRLIHRLGRPVTRLLLSPRLRRSRLATAAYARLYVLGKTLSERRERALLRRQVRPGMVIFDVGANLGFYTKFLSSLVGPAGRVHAFEPDPLSFDILRRRTRHLTNVHLTRSAAGDHAGSVTLFCNRANRADNRVYPHQGEEETEPCTVPLTTLDDYCAAHAISRIDGVKMDVQGAEVAVLEGFRRTLSTLRPSWMLIEFAPALLAGAGSSSRAFWAILNDLGFEPWSFDERGSPFRIEDETELSRRYEGSYTDVWARPR
ncbi:MAG TPA: FkbM family methyltransferase [Thermoanaerobaculia bacterium]|nr:FkbM family methyltransferase [Thermoanaerobaculia bacterium]